MKSFEVSNIYKMIEKMSQINDLYNELSEETRQKINDEFDYDKRPTFLIRQLDIVLDNTVDIINEIIAEQKVNNEKTENDSTKRFKDVDISDFVIKERDDLEDELEI